MIAVRSSFCVAKINFQALSRLWGRCVLWRVRDTAQRMSGSDKVCFRFDIPERQAEHVALHFVTALYSNADKITIWKGPANPGRQDGLFQKS